jgi:hypothetical protein
MLYDPGIIPYAMRFSLTTVLTALLLVVLTACMPVGTTTNPKQGTGKKLICDDKNYEAYVGNVILNSNNPFVELKGSQNIQLEFDLLTEDFENLQARWIHCNADWTPSALQDLQFLQVFNRFDHRSFDYSVNTQSPYVRYFFRIVRPYITGNYILALYRRDNPEDYLFTRRLVFYRNEVPVNGHLRLPTQVKYRTTHQQLDIELNFGGVEAPDPARNFKVIALQNADWDYAWEPKMPTMINQGSKVMEWKPLDGSNAFPGWNQFRFLDVRTLNLKGINVNKIIKEENGMTLVQATDTRQWAASYRQLINDNNGRFIPGNSDPGESWIEADYADVLLSYKTPKLRGKVYVTGRFNWWERGDENRMYYDAEAGMYIGSIRLKQGYYDYRYEVVGGDQPRYYLEGSHFQADNEYQILVYYRAPGAITDEVLALQRLRSVNFF